MNGTIITRLNILGITGLNGSRVTDILTTCRTRGRSVMMFVEI